jgi:hypothetical protein
MRSATIRQLLAVALVCGGLTGYGQEKKTPDYYLNSVKMTMTNVFMNTNNIDSIKVLHKTSNGEVYITTKSRFKGFISLDEVLKGRTDARCNSGEVILRINGEAIDDTTDVRIDATYFISVKTKRLSDVKYLDPKYHRLVVVDISLKSEEEKPSVKIRGNDDFQSAYNTLYHL